ncbi:MAG: hypothetical protein RR337_09325, partial [Clostridia bacterium]
MPRGICICDMPLKVCDFLLILVLFVTKRASRLVFGASTFLAIAAPMASALFAQVIRKKKHRRIKQKR